MSSIKRFFIVNTSFKVSFIGGSTATAGESGLVYRGYINSGELVAVKTGKGWLAS